MHHVIDTPNPSRNRVLRGFSPEQEIFTTSQVRRILGVSYPTVCRYVEKGLLSCFRINGYRRFRREEIENLILSGGGNSPVGSEQVLESV